MPFQRSRKDPNREDAVASGPGDEHVGSRVGNELHVAIRNCRDCDGAPRRQDVLEFDSRVFEVAFALRDPDRREVQAGGRGRQPDFDGLILRDDNPRLTAEKKTDMPDKKRIALSTLRFST